MPRILLVLCLFLCCPAFAADFVVGQTERSFTPKEQRNWRGADEHVLTAMIWYPATSGATVRHHDFGPPNHPIFRGLDIAHDAKPLRTDRSLPLLLLSHGTGGSGASLAWLGGALAAKGYVVAAVDHPGNTALGRLTPEGFSLWWERADDMKDLLDMVLADPQLGPAVDGSRIGAVGFSLGGYTVLELAGAHTNRQAFTDFCHSALADAICTPPEIASSHVQNPLEGLPPSAETDASVARSGNSFRDPRVHAVFAIAPALGMAFDQGGLRDVAIPVEMLAGSADVTVPVATNAQRFARMLPKARLTVLPGATHYSFIDDCIGDTLPALYCKEKPGVDRDAIHAQAIELAAAFFDKALEK
jgi:predicted dienelactone hydrolase